MSLLSQVHISNEVLTITSRKYVHVSTFSCTRFIHFDDSIFGTHGLIKCLLAFLDDALFFLEEFPET